MDNDIKPDDQHEGRPQEPAPPVDPQVPPASQPEAPSGGELSDAPKPVPVQVTSVKPIISKPITRPVEKAASEGEGMDRRSFVKWLTLGWAAFAAIVAGYGTLMMRFLFPNVLFEPKQSFTAGMVDDYVIGEVSERFKEKYGVWIVRDSEKIFALSTICTHLGCTPNWLTNEQKFKCPCHGSGFYKNGINFEGPAPRPLERFKVALSDDGEIIIDKSKKFQEEKGEWSDPESFLLT